MCVCVCVCVETYTFTPFKTFINPFNDLSINQNLLSALTEWPYSRGGSEERRVAPALAVAVVAVVPFRMWEGGR